MPVAKSTSPYAISTFHLVIDGIDITSFVKNVEGGFYKVEVTEEKVGPTTTAPKHLAARSVEPITFDLGMCDSNWVLGLIEKMVNNREHATFNGAISHCDANMVERYHQAFKGASLVEVTFPALAGDAKEPAYLKVKMQPTSTEFSKGSGRQLTTTKFPQQQRLWGTNRFHFQLGINGRDFNCSRASKIESFTIKVGNKVARNGSEYAPEYVPGNVTFPNVSFHLPLQDADQLISWYQESVTNASPSLGEMTGAGNGYEAAGGIDVLSQDGKKTLYSFELEGCVPYSLSFTKAEAGSNTVRGTKVELAVQNMKFKTS